MEERKAAALPTREREGSVTAGSPVAHEEEGAGSERSSPAKLAAEALTDEEEEAEDDDDIVEAGGVLAPALDSVSWAGSAGGGEGGTAPADVAAKAPDLTTTTAALVGGTKNGLAAFLAGETTAWAQAQRSPPQPARAPGRRYGLAFVNSLSPHSVTWRLVSAQEEGTWWRRRQVLAPKRVESAKQPRGEGGAGTCIRRARGRPGARLGIRAGPAGGGSRGDR